MDVVRSVIVRGLQRRNWTITQDQPGQIAAHPSIGGKATEDVIFTYTSKTYKIDFQVSDDERYNEEVSAHFRSIDGELQRLPNGPR